MMFFTTPELLEIGGLPLVSPFEKPTRLEALRYYRRVVDTYELAIEFGEQVVDVSANRRQAGPRGRHGDVFDIETRSETGVRRIRHSRNVIFAIGYFDHPNVIGVPGENLPHVSHYYNESHGFYRKNVVIVGGGNSAAETALELYRSGANVTLVHRHPQLKPSIKYWVRPDIENRIKEGSVKGLFNTQVVEIQPTQVIVERDGAKEVHSSRCRVPADRLPPRLRSCIAARASGCIARRCRRSSIRRRSRRTCPGIFLAGGAICGRDTSNIFIENGRFHGEAIIKTIAARRATRGAVPLSAERRMTEPSVRAERTAMTRQSRRSDVQIHPPSVRAETINVIKAALAIVLIVAAYIFRPSFGAQSPISNHANRHTACCRISS